MDYHLILFKFVGLDFILLEKDSKQTAMDGNIYYFIILHIHIILYMQPVCIIRSGVLYCT